MHSMSTRQDAKMNCKSTNIASPIHALMALAKSYRIWSKTSASITLYISNTLLCMPHRAMVLQNAWFKNTRSDREKFYYLPRQSNMKPVPVTWFFKQKQLDVIDKHFMEKGRRCLRGDRKLIYVDYDPSSTYEPVASHDAIRMLITIAAEDNLILDGADVSNACLYGDIDIPIIMEQPTNSRQVPAAPGHVCKLLKSMYGTKQAGEIWGSLLDKTLISWGFKNAELNSRIYMYQHNNEYDLIVIVVGDLAPLRFNEPLLGLSCPSRSGKVLFVFMFCSNCFALCFIYRFLRRWTLYMCGYPCAFL